VDSGVIPGACLNIRGSNQDLHNYAVGRAEVRPRQREASLDTVWDLASLTKVLATTPIAMAMVADKRLHLHEPIGRFFPEAPDGVTASHLLSHTSGMAAWLPMVDRFEPVAMATDAQRSVILKLAMEQPLVAAPGEQHLYSDLGFITLCALLERVSNQPLDELFDVYVRQPSGVDLRWGWPNAAATEDCPHRKQVVVGEVHDLNAWLMGGVSSHAGLFGTAASVSAVAAWQLRAYRGEDKEGLRPDVVRAFFDARHVGSHRLGWDGVSPNGSAGPLWPKDGVGHLAFTGCSIWVAPKQDVIVTFCSNRIHPEIEGGAVPDAPAHPRYTAFRALRQAIHTVIIKSLVASSRWP
jgi:CubicO group peptidase (beta-lactamase class C family)